MWKYKRDEKSLKLAVIQHQNKRMKSAQLVEPLGTTADPGWATLLQRAFMFLAYLLLQPTTALPFAHRVYLWVSCDSRISRNSINQLIFVLERHSILFAVKTGCFTTTSIYTMTIEEARARCGLLSHWRRFILCWMNFVLERFFSYGTTTHTWALSSSLLRLLNHVQLDARYDSSGRVISPSQRSLPTQDNTTYKYKR
jgi:hypothetical protein